MTAEQLGDALNGSPEPEVKAAEEPVREEEKREPEVVAEPAQPETVSKDEYEKLKTDLDKERVRRENQDKLLSRLGTELGMLRKNTPEEEAAKLQEIRDLYWQDPVEGHKALEAYREEQKRKGEDLEKQAFVARVDENKANVLKWTPDFESTIDDMAKLVEQDGADPQSVSMFKQNPYVLDPTTLYNLNARARLAKENTDLKTRIDALEKEVGELKKKPGELVEKIEKAVSQPSPVTAKTGGGKGADSPITPKPVWQMTRAELDAATRPTQ